MSTLTDDEKVNDLIEYRNMSIRDDADYIQNRVRDRIYVFEEDVDKQVLFSRSGIDGFLEIVGMGICIAVALLTVYMIFNSLFVF